MIEFKVSDITCGHCAQAITTAVKEVDDKAVVEVSVPERRVRIESQRDRDAFAAAIREAGYTPA